MEVPSHCGQINLTQILNADGIAFQRMAEYTKNGTSMRPNGTFPLQEALAVARAHPIFTTSPAPIPKSNARKTSLTLTRPNKGKGKGKGAGSVKGVPRDLVNYWTRNKQGQARCYDFNLPKGYSEKCDQGKCLKGLPQCVGCGSSDHCLQSCPCLTSRFIACKGFRKLFHRICSSSVLNFVNSELTSECYSAENFPLQTFAKAEAGEENFALIKSASQKRFH
jgi:hypothetical protein